MKKTLFLMGVAGLITYISGCKPDPKIDLSPTESDSLYIGTKYSLPTTIPGYVRFPRIDNPYADSLTYEGIELGRRLFYDKHLSSTQQLSCGSCHKAEYSFSDGGNATSTNVNGATRRNAPAIINMVWDTKFFWDGRVNTLADQAQDAFHGEQNLNIPDAINYLSEDSVYTALFKKAFGRPGTVTEGKIYLALQQFMMAMVSYQSKYDKSLSGNPQFALTQSERTGFEIFSTDTFPLTGLRGGDCFHCHRDGISNLFIPPQDGMFRNNGLDSVPFGGTFVDGGRGEITGASSDIGLFKAPSLRNIALTAPYMHDGRFQTLEEVIDFYSTGIKMSPTVDPVMKKTNHSNGGVNLTATQKQDLINFLHTLTDTSFTNNPMFSDPFQ